jgi:hypothetical protein
MKNAARQVSEAPTQLSQLLVTPYVVAISLGLATH